MQPQRWKMAVIIWMGIYPTTTLVLWLMSPFITEFPLPIKTLCLTLVVVPIMAFTILPMLTKAFRRWLQS
jgi:uncharacterized protein